MLDLLEASEDEILECLVPVLVDDTVAPPEEGFRSLRAALDLKFRAEVEDLAPVVPLHHRFVRVVSAVAAAVVVLAVGLGLYSLQKASGPSRAPAKLDDAAAVLRSALRTGDPPARVAQDVTNLARALATSPASSGTGAVAPNQLLASACRWLEGSTVSSASLPPACRASTTSAALGSSTSDQAGGSSNGGQQPGFAPDRGSPDPTRQPSDEPGSWTNPMGPGGDRSTGDPSPTGIAPPTDGQQSFSYRSGAATPTAPQPGTDGFGGQTWPGGARPWHGSTFQGPNETTYQEPNTPSATNDPTTSPVSGSPRMTPTTTCSVDACDGGRLFTQGSAGAPSFQR